MSSRQCNVGVYDQGKNKVIRCNEDAVINHPVNETTQSWVIRCKDHMETDLGVEHRS